MPNDRSRPRAPRPLDAGLRLLATSVWLGGVIAAAPCARAAAGGVAIGRAHGGGGAGFGYSIGTSSAHGRMAFQYAVIGPGHNSTCAFDGDQSTSTIGKLQDEVVRTGGQVLWFAIDGREYVVRDKTTVERAQEIVEPMSRLGAEQGKLGSQQGELGRRQGELGQLQGEVAQVQAHLAVLESRDDPRYRAELDELRQQLRELSVQVRALGVRQSELGAQQAVLGRRQSELGAQQRRASLLAFDQLKSLADKSIASGKAEALDSD